MSLDAANHKSILVRILKEIFTDPQVGPILGFKGGTAAYLFYDLDRFSVDLDFDLLDSVKVEFVYEKMKEMLQKYGRIKIADKKRYSLIYILVYNDKEPEAQNVKIEVNLRNFGSRYTIKHYLGISMKVMIPEDMAANKLVALYERIGRTNRDVYDTWFFFNHGWEVNKELVERRTGMTYRKFLESCCGLLEKLNNRQILSGMGEVLNEKQKSWVKSHLKDELIFLLRVSIENQQ